MTTQFKIDDIVEATTTIRRKDGLSMLLAGDRVRVRQVWQTTPESPQIIGVDIEGKAPMIDIVCFENTPFRLVKPEGEDRSKC